MCLLKTVERIKYLDFLIRGKNTGTASKLAEQIGVSERTIFNYLTDLKNMGAPVLWSSQEESYIYKNSVQFILGFLSEYPPEQDNMNHFRLGEEKIPGRQEIINNN